MAFYNYRKYNDQNDHRIFFITNEINKWVNNVLQQAMTKDKSYLEAGQKVLFKVALNYVKLIQNGFCLNYKFVFRIRRNWCEDIPLSWLAAPELYYMVQTSFILFYLFI